MPASPIQAAARERIRALYPGEKFKTLRNRLYATPGFLDMNPTDQMIMDEAGVSPEESKDEPPAAKKAKPVLEGTVLDEGQVYKEALALPVKALPVIVNTPEDYQEADKGFSAIKKMLKDLETERTSITKPLLDSKKRIDDKYKASADILNTELKRYEVPMLAFKTREREELRSQEQERTRLIQEAQREAQKVADEAKAALEAAHKAEDAAEETDPFLAALLAEDVAELQVQTKEALVAVALAPSRVELPEMVTPVVASGSRVTNAWMFEIVDEDLVARAYCSPDTKKIHALVKMLKEAHNGDITKLNMEAYPGMIIKEEIRLGSR